METESNFVEKFIKEHKSIAIAAIALLVLLVIGYMNVFLTKKSINLTFDSDVVLKSGEKFKITWTAKKVGRVGIALFDGSEASWIAKDIPARQGFYEWNIFIYQKPSSNYRIAVFEYPWRTDGAIAYTNKEMEILGPRYASCDRLSIENEWPYVPSDLENTGFIFISDSSWDGKLGGFAGADDKCRKEAEKKGLDGKYIAFVGSDDEPAKSRVTKDLIFISPEKDLELPEGRSCHRLIARDLDDLISKLTLSSDEANRVFEESFLKKLNGVWLGKITNSTKKNCLPIIKNGSSQQGYSYTVTCKNWEENKKEAYAGGNIPEYVDLPRCYDDSGRSFPANQYGAFALVKSLNGELAVSQDNCSNRNRLFCIQQ